MRGTKFSSFRKNVEMKFIVDSYRYIIAKMKEIPKFSGEVFSIIRDEKGITVIAKEGIEIRSIFDEKFFKRITFDVNLPFNLTGFLSHVSSLLANRNIPVFVISAYSTDHLFVREEDSEKAIETLKKNGMRHLS